MLSKSFKLRVNSWLQFNYYISRLIFLITNNPHQTYYNHRNIIFKQSYLRIMFRFLLIADTGRLQVPRLSVHQERVQTEATTFITYPTLNILNKCLTPLYTSFVFKPQYPLHLSVRSFASIHTANNVAEIYMRLRLPTLI